MRLDDPQVVRNEYATDAGLAGRIAAYRFAEGPDAREEAFRAVAEVRPRRVLEVGCGQGWLSERIQRELACDVVAVDQSEHMVDLTRARTPGGRLVAVTNARDSLRELGDLVGFERPETTFSAENGEAQLRAHFPAVERREAYGSILFPSRREAQDYLDHSLSWGGRQLPEFDGPLRVQRAPVIFIAETAR